MATFLDTRYKLWHCLRMRLVEGVVWMGWDRDSVWITSNKWFVTTEEGLTFSADARNFLPVSTESNASSFTHGDWWWQRADRSSATPLHSLPLMVLGSYKRKKWLKSFIPSHSPRERREAYLRCEGVVVGGGTAGKVFEEDHGDPDGRMRDGESEEAAIA